jgi:hypothetical protein
MDLLERLVGEIYLQQSPRMSRRSIRNAQLSRDCREALKDPKAIKDVAR